MDFDFSPEQLAFRDEVEALPRRATTTPMLFDLTRENMAQIVDTPEPPRVHAQDRGAGLARHHVARRSGAARKATASTSTCSTRRSPARGGPQIGKGVGIIGKTILRHGSEKLKQEFLPKILAQRHRVRGRLQRARRRLRRGVDEAQGHARDGDGWRLNGQKTWTTSAHFAEWYWVGARTDPEASKHHGITLFLVPLDHPASPSTRIWTMGDERTNDVFFDDVFVPDDYVVGELNHGFQYISEALDLERFTMFTFSPIEQRLDLLCDYVRHRDASTTSRCATTRWSASEIARLATEAEVARLLGLRVRGQVDEGRRAAHRRSRRSTSSSRPSCRSGSRTRRWTSARPATQLRVHTETRR